MDGKIEPKMLGNNAPALCSPEPGNLSLRPSALLRMELKIALAVTIAHFPLYLSKAAMLEFGIDRGGGIEIQVVVGDSSESSIVGNVDIAPGPRSQGYREHD